MFLLGLGALLQASCSSTECGSGTKDVDGVCVPTSLSGTPVTCGPGTRVQNNVCVPTGGTANNTDNNTDNNVDNNTPGNNTTPSVRCGEGTRLENDSCIPEDIICAPGQAYDTTEKACTPVLGCGPGTEANDRNVCLPRADLCGAGTDRDENGRCVVRDLITCGPQTQLDPNLAACVPTNAVCGTNTAYDSRLGKCMPLDTVCATGTYFNFQTSTCLAEASCAPGDVVFNNLCTRPAEQLAALATAESNMGDNNTTTGAQAIPTGGGPVNSRVVFKGTIAAPDLSRVVAPGDGQDIDKYKFQATAGQWYKIVVQSLGMPQPAFLIEGPTAEGATSLRRITSPVGVSPSPAREFFIPYSGTHYITILPEASMLALLTESRIGPFGGDDWNYVVTLEPMSAPTPIPVDARTAEAFSGSHSTPRSSRFLIQTDTNRDVVRFKPSELGISALSSISFWSSDTELIGLYDNILDTQSWEIPVPANGTLYAVMDWTEMRGPLVGYNVGTKVIGGQASPTINAGQTAVLNFNAPPGKILRVRQTNPGALAMGVRLAASNNATLTFNASLGDGEDVKAVYAAGGSFTVNVTNSNQVAVTPVIEFRTLDLRDLGQGTIGSQASASSTQMLELNASEYFLITLDQSATLSGTLTSTSGDPDLRVRNTDFSIVASSAGSGNESYSIALTAGTYLLEVQAYEPLPSGFNLSVIVSSPPVIEVEPNDNIAQAGSIIIPGGTATGTLTSDQDYDVWKFTLNQPLAVGEVVLAQAMTSSLNKNLKCELMDSNGNNLVASAISRNGCASFAQGLAAGTYYVRLSTDTGGGVAYTIGTRIVTNARAESEGNNSPGAANVLGNAPVTVYGEVSSEPDVDYFGFTLTSTVGVGEKLVIDISDLGIVNSATKEVLLYDAGGNMVYARTISSQLVYEVNDQDQPTLDAGNYKILIRREINNTPPPSAGFYAMTVRKN